MMALIALFFFFLALLYKDMWLFSSVSHLFLKNLRASFSLVLRTFQATLSLDSGIFLIMTLTVKQIQHN